MVWVPGSPPARPAWESWPLTCSTASDFAQHRAHPDCQRFDLLESGYRDGVDLALVHEQQLGLGEQRRERVGQIVTQLAQALGVGHVILDSRGSGRPREPALRTVRFRGYGGRATMCRSRHRSPSAGAAMVNGMEVVHTTLYGVASYAMQD